jgi:hypothetical protein
MLRVICFNRLPTDNSFKLIILETELFIIIEKMKTMNIPANRTYKIKTVSRLSYYINSEDK